MKKLVLITVFLLCAHIAASINIPLIKEVYTPEPIIYVIFDDPTNITVTSYSLSTGFASYAQLPSGENISENDSANISAEISVPTFIDLNPPNQTGNTFIFEPMLEIGAGNYTFKVTAEDYFGNSGTFTSEFTIVELPFNVSIVDPPYSVASSKTFSIKLKTFDNASCRYKNTDDTYDNSYLFVDDGKFHTLSSYSLLTENSDYPLYVKCLSVYGDVAAVLFTLRYDTSPPIIQSLTAPDTWNNKVVEPIRSATLQAVTDEESRCEYSQNGDPYKKFSEEFSTNSTKKLIGLEDFTTHNFKVKCMNKAQLYSSEKEISIEVNTGLGLGISIISPTQYASSLTVPFIISTSKSSSCLLAQGNNNFTIPLSSVDGVSHTYTESFAAGGNYTYKVGCSYLKVTANGSGYDFSTADINFVVDTTEPAILNVTDEGITSSLTNLKAIVLAEDPESGIKNYYFAIGTAAYSEDIKNWTLSESPTLSASDLNLSDGSTYYFSVIAENNAGMNSSIAFSNGVTVNSSFIGGNFTEEVINRAGCLTDQDGDGYGLGCVSGYDCNDKDPSVNAGNCGNGCIQDSDGDGYGVGCYSGRDCKDTDPSISFGCADSCRIDMDGDGYGPGCFSGPDCNDYSSETIGSCDTGKGCTNDDDCDGMDNEWEIDNGLNPDFDDSGADNDNDGISNLEEYRKNTDPNSTGESPTTQLPQRTNNTQQQQAKKGIDWMLITIIVIFLLLVGIGGYYAYTNFMPKKQQTAGQPAPKPQTAAQRAAAARVTAVQGPTLTPMQRRQIAERKTKEIRRDRISKERASMFESFNRGKAEQPAAEKKEAPQPVISEVGKRILRKAYEKPSKAEPEEFKGLSKFLNKEDVFDRLETMKQPVKDVFEKIGSLEKKEFNKLDNIIKEKNMTEGEVFDKLAKVGTKKASRDDFVNKLDNLINRKSKR